MNRESPSRVGYRVRNLKSGLGPGRVYSMRIGKAPHYFQGIGRFVAKRLMRQQFSLLAQH